jgi:hypothetical protein
VVVAADVFGSQVGMGIVEEDIDLVVLEVDRGSSVVGCLEDIEGNIVRVETEDIDLVVAVDIDPVGQGS